jgi:hypothetical protein
MCHVPSGWRSTPLASYTPLPMVLFPTCHCGHAPQTTGGALGQLQFRLLSLQHRPTGLSGQGFSTAGPDAVDDAAASTGTIDRSIAAAKFRLNLP